MRLVFRMQLTAVQLFPRRFLNSPYHCFRRSPRKFSKIIRNERIFRFSGWLYSDARDKFKIAAEFVRHAWTRQTDQRRMAPKIRGWFHKKRLEGALEEHRMTLKVFQDILERMNIKLNLEMLSFLALYEPASFKSLAMMTRQLALDEKITGISNREPLPENVILPRKL